MTKPYYMRPKPTAVPSNMNAWVDLQNFCIHRVSHGRETIPFPMPPRY